mgnify:CR=1 FL=1
MIGNIYINGQIGSFDGVDGVELVDIIRQVKKQPNAQSFKVHINSEGGDADLGFDIYNYLKSLGVPIHTVGSSLVASIATVIFMAGDTRVLKEGTYFMIHLPWGVTQGTAEELEKYSKYVKECENRLVKFYTDSLGITKEAVEPLLKNETWLDITEAQDLGITTEAYMKVAAKAYFNSNTNKQMSNLTKEEAEGLFSKFEAKFKSIFAKAQIQNKILQDANGMDIDFVDVAEDGTPVVGDKAVVDGEDAEGEHLMPSGETLVFVGGELTEIKPVEDAPDEEMEALKKTNEELTATVEALNVEKAELQESISNMQKDVKELKSTITSKYDIEDAENKKEKKEIVNSAKNALEELRKKRK